MDGLSNAASVIAVIQLAGSVVQICGGYIAEVKGARRDIEHVQREIESLTAILQNLLQLLQNRHGTELSTSGVLQENIAECLQTLEDLNRKIEQPKRSQPVMKRLGLRALKWPLKREEVMKVVSRLERNKSSISLALEMDQIAILDRLEKTTASTYLPIAEGAAFDSYLNQHVSECLQGTRTELLQRISNWAVSPQRECIFWLKGMAGTGKSAVARTVAGSWKNKGLLGASFFFKRGEGDCGNATKFFSTIAQQLMITTPSLQSAIRKAVEDEPNIRSKSLREQFDKLILNLILTTAHDRSRRIILVVDALDECAEEEDIQILVRLLSQIQRPDFTPLRIFITSRPELPIRLSFQQLGVNYKEFALHDIAMDIIGHDISTFLKERLTRIRQQFILRGRQLPLSWPGEENLKAMTVMTVPLFIFAATICRLLEDDQWNPVDTLNEVLAHQSDVSKLDGTYLPVLNRILIRQPEGKKTRLTKEYKSVIGFIILLENSLSVISLSRLMGIPKETIHMRLDSLHSVFSIPADETEPVRPFHLSFRDFLVDTETKEKTPFWVDESDMHQEIANRCLAILNQDLQKNVCRIPNYAIKWVDIPYTLVKKHLTEEIQYACRYWIHHTCQYQLDAAQTESVFKFLTTHYTHWLESMSILGLVSEVVKSIDKLLTHIKKQTDGDELISFLRDAKRFALRNTNTFDLVPLQIYCAGLIFAPSRSIVRNFFSNEIPNWHKRLPDADEPWTASTQMLEGHRNLIRAISFSPNGSKLISYSQDGTARLWDAHTGVCQQIIEEDRGQFSPVVFTQSGAILIASWVPYEDTVRIWDISTGTCIHTLNINSKKLEPSGTDSSNVIIARISPDGRKLASISGDDDLRIWHIGKELDEHALEGHTGKALNIITFSTNEYMATASLDDNIELCHLGTEFAVNRYTLRGHKGPVTNIVFSPTNSTLASSSTDCVVRLWDMSTGGCQHILEGHATTINNVTGITDIAFSPDERTLASSSYDCTVRLWDISAGACLHILQDHSDWVQAVAFSPNGRMLASVGDDYTVRLYNTHTPSSNLVLRGHGREVQTVAFSPDNNILASGSNDYIIRLWETSIEHVEHIVSEAHSSLVCAVVFSSDGDLVASASVDCTVRLWDANTGDCKLTLKGHKNAVETIAFSPDGCILASGSRDCTVRLWDTDTGACRYVLQGSSSKAAGVTVVRFSPTRPMLASGCRFEHVVRLWNTDTSTCQFVLDCLAGVSIVAFSPDGSILASAAWRRIEDLGENGKAASDRDATIRLWDTSTGTNTLALESPTVAEAISFSPEGHRLASASYDRSMRLWDISTGACEQTIDNASVQYPVTNPLLKKYPEHYGQTSSPPLCVYKEWISCGEQDVIWLPPDYRPVSAAVFNGKVALGHSSGRVSFMEFDLTTIASL